MRATLLTLLCVLVLAVPVHPAGVLIDRVEYDVVVELLFYDELGRVRNPLLIFGDAYIVRANICNASRGTLTEIEWDASAPMQLVTRPEEDLRYRSCWTLQQRNVATLDTLQRVHTIDVRAKPRLLDGSIGDDVLESSDIQIVKWKARLSEAPMSPGGLAALGLMLAAAAIWVMRR